MHFRNLIFLFPIIVLAFSQAVAQQTNPVEQQLANPITDTPNINPVASPQEAKSVKKKDTSFEQEGGDGELVVYSEHQSVEGEEGKRIIVHEGNVDARYGIYRLQADKITIYEAQNLMDAEGSVVFDQGDDQRITGSRAKWNYKTKLGTFEDSTGFTNQTNDGTVIYFTADKVERVSLDEVIVTKGEFTACEEAVPKWSFTADEASIKINDRVKLKNGKFRVKDIPIVPLPYASIPIKERDRASGFLTPTFGFSGDKGFRLSNAYYLTLGRSADVTFRGDIYSSRGIGYGMDVRTRANSRSYLDFGFYAVKDRIFGAGASPEHPDQGGSIFYAEGVHYFSNGFTGAVDARITSNLDFRQVFSDGIQQIISPIENSQVSLNKSWNNYTMNVLARSQVISLPNVRVSTRNLPSIHFEKRPSRLSFLDALYFSFETSLEGVSRRETVDDIARYRLDTGSDPIRTPALLQRLDFHPKFTLPLSFKYLNITMSGGARVTYYSNSFNDMRQVLGKDLIRKYGEFELDIRPTAFAKNFYGKDDKFKFRHVIEPYVTYRYAKGVDNFENIIRFDQMDTYTDTNEVEFGVINRIYTRRYAEAVTDDAQKLLTQRGDDDRSDVTIQPYEIFSLSVRGKYFFDKTFGGALTPGQRNQIAPITAMSFYTFGGVPRRWSPLIIDATYRPQRTIFANTRMDLGLNGDGLRAFSSTIGYDKPLFKLFQTFYYTRAVELIPSLAQYSNRVGTEAGTLRGAQWSPSVFIGNREKGIYGGASLFYDFENRRKADLSPLISSLYTLGYAYDCCSLAVQFYTFSVGVRNENRLSFSFRLNGIGSVGTERDGRYLR